MIYIKYLPQVFTHLQSIYTFKQKFNKWSQLFSRSPASLLADQQIYLSNLGISLGYFIYTSNSSCSSPILPSKWPRNSTSLQPAAKPEILRQYSFTFIYILPSAHQFTNYIWLPIHFQIATFLKCKIWSHYSFA